MPCTPVLPALLLCESLSGPAVLPFSWQFLEAEIISLSLHLESALRVFQ